MEFIKSTAEVLAFKVLNRPYDETWVNWAIDMLMAGFDTKHLGILAGENPPFDYFYLNDLTTKVLKELNLDYSDKEQVINNYVCFLVGRVLNNEIANVDALSALKDLYIELGYAGNLNDFYLLYFAKEDLNYGENQWYWEGANRSNIDKIITDCFKKWKSNCKDKN